MTDVLSKIPLVGWGPIITIAALAVICLIIAILLWRNHKVWRWIFVALFLVIGLGAAADYVNTQVRVLRQRRRPARDPDLPDGGRALSGRQTSSAAQRRRRPHHDHDKATQFG